MHSFIYNRLHDKRYIACTHSGGKLVAFLHFTDTVKRILVARKCVLAARRCFFYFIFVGPRDLLSALMLQGACITAARLPSVGFAEPTYGISQITI